MDESEGHAGTTKTQRRTRGPTSGPDTIDLSHLQDTSGSEAEGYIIAVLLKKSARTTRNKNPIHMAPPSDADVSEDEIEYKSLSAYVPPANMKLHTPVTIEM